MTPDDEPTVPIVCPRCETSTDVPLPDVAETLDRHNDGVHDGETVAQIDPDLAAELQNLVAEDMGLLDR